MKALTIKDLSRAVELDASSMSAIHGGMFKGGYAFCMPSYNGPRYDFDASSVKFDASQQLGQSQNTVVNNGNNVAFASGITANVTPTQSGSNNIHFG
jgi:hypothetical protein